MENSNKSNKTETPKVTVTIVQGKRTPAQIRQYHAAWARLIAKALSEDAK